MVAIVAATGPARSEQPDVPKVRVLDEFCSPFDCKKTRSDGLARPPEPLGSALTQKELAAEIRKVEAGVDACGRVVNASGTMMTNVVIHVDGRVTSVNVTGRFANTPVAACVLKTLKSMRFRGNAGLSLRYPFVFRPGTIRGCGGDEKKVNAAALQQLRAPLALCGGAQASKISVRFALDAGDVIFKAEAQQASGARDPCVERVLACVLGSVADDLPARWEVGLEAHGSAYATLRPLDPGGGN